MEKRMNKKLMLMFMTLFAALVVLAACGGDNEPGDDPSTDETPTEAVADNDDDNGDDNGGADAGEPFDAFAAIDEALERTGFQIAFENPNEMIEGGTLRYGFGSTVPLSGIFEGVFTSTTTETDLRTFTHDLLLFAGEDFFPSNTNSLASATYDRESQTVTITKNIESVWADGVPLTLDDLVFAYEVISHPDYTGARWDDNMRNVVGTQAFRDGEVDYIAGLTLSEDKMELTIEFYNFTPFTYAFAFWNIPMPRHHWEGIEVADMPEHPRARFEVLGNGPFKIDGYVPGESVRFVRNENFWRGHAQLDEVIFEVVDPMIAPDVARSGRFDVINFPQSLSTEANLAMDNVTFLGNPWNNNNNFWLGFRMGDWSDDESRVITWDEPRLSEDVRVALALAVNHLGAANAFFNGVSFPSPSTYWPLRRVDWIDRSIPLRNDFNLELANQILDDAGYDQRDSDGFRLNPDGTPLVVIYLAATGSEANINNRHLELDNWRYELGVDVQLYDGRLVDATVQAEAIRYNTSEFDMFTFGVMFGANPAPIFCCSAYSRHNNTRYSSPEWQYAFDRFFDDRMWDEDFVLETVQIWQEAVADANVMFPTNMSINPIMAVNNRVANFSLAHNDGDNEIPGLWNPWLWGLTADDTYVATN